MPLSVDIPETLLASPASSQEGNCCIMDNEKKLYLVMLGL